MTLTSWIRRLFHTFLHALRWAESLQEYDLLMKRDVKVYQKWFREHWPWHPGFGSCYKNGSVKIDHDILQISTIRIFKLYPKTRQRSFYRSVLNQVILEDVVGELYPKFCIQVRHVFYRVRIENCSRILFFKENTAKSLNRTGNLTFHTNRAKGCGDLTLRNLR